MRVAKPMETLVSLSGSPVYTGPGTSGRGRGKKGSDDFTVPVRLGGGQTLMVPMQSPTAGEECQVSMS